jgi:hypothetical protein
MLERWPDMEASLADWSDPVGGYLCCDGRSMPPSLTDHTAFPGLKLISCELLANPEYIILDDFFVFYPGYTRALPGVFQWSRVFHILKKSAIT